MNYKNLIPDDIDDRIELKMTCFACPEQYDMYFDGKHVGYFRLRHGEYTVSKPFPDNYGEGNNYERPELLYEAQPKGDGDFFDDEREFYLTMGKIAVLESLGVIRLDQEIPLSPEPKKKKTKPANPDAPLIRF